MKIVNKNWQRKIEIEEIPITKEKIVELLKK